MRSPIDNARAVAVTLLNLESIRTPDVIRAQVRKAVGITPGLSQSDEEALVAKLMHEANVHVPNATLMDDPADHIEWLPAKRGSIEWRFWNRYKAFLEQEKQFPEPVVSALGKLTDDILSKLEDPGRPPNWDCRGMVVGSVQSGKTANYCGLICKAIDAGYKLIVVLAGMHNNLRSQTQYRIDEGVLGRDSQKDRNLDQTGSLIGVGKLFTELLHVTTLTSSLEDGDFRAPKADTSVDIGSQPVVLVIKKNSSVLKNLLKWVLHVRGKDLPSRARKVVPSVPLLVIDDEADNASVNTKERKHSAADDNSVTAINGRIRELLDAFEKSAYVGYTATPFANIFINPDAETPKHGEDLFPRSFILNVPPPSNYISPARVFGLDGDVDAGIEPKQGLPLCKIVVDHQASFPEKHKKELVVTELPESLKKALLCFIITCATRRARGEKWSHNSMLVHVTRFINVQHQVAQSIQQIIDSIRRQLEFGEPERQLSILTPIKNLWETEFIPVSQQVCVLEPNDEFATVTWEQVVVELRESVARIEVKEINGHAADALNYVAHKRGINVVAVGGDKLSRGLTLEGLSVSYFLRASQMYDTLMQMGRWFGYRPGYLDLCRLFTTEDLQRWYRHIALAEVELRREFDRMQEAGLTPKRYGLRVREHPGGLLVTALNKMTHARTQKLSYAGQIVQTAHFLTDPAAVINNAEVVNQFLESLGGERTAIMRKAAWIWKDISFETLLNHLLRDFTIDSQSWRFQKPELVEFIRRQAGGGELTNWTVALINTDGNSGTFKLAGCMAGVAERTPEDGTWENGLTPRVYSVRNANILSPSHQAIDLDEMILDDAVLTEILAKRTDYLGGSIFNTAEETILRNGCANRVTLGKAAFDITAIRKQNGVDKEGTHRINGLVARVLRPKTNGLLLIYTIFPTDKRKRWQLDVPFIGLALSFPASHTARSVDYKVNRIWQDTFPNDDTDED